MDTVLVTGGTGHLGKELVALLKPTHRVRVLTRKQGADPGVEWAGGDLSTGTGLTEALHGVQSVIHAATYSPIAERGYPVPHDMVSSPPDVDVDGTSVLLDEAAKAGVHHFLYVSVVGGADPRGPYLRLKHTAEELVSVGGMPWTVVRATPFHWLIDRILDKMARLPALPLPSGIIAQPVATRDFAEYVVACLRDGPGEVREEFGGPEVLSLPDLVDQWKRARARSIRTLNVPSSTRFVRATQSWTCPDARRGKTTWSEWLHQHDD